MDAIDCYCTAAPRGCRLSKRQTIMLPSAFCTLKQRIIDHPEMRALLYDCSDSDFDTDCFRIAADRQLIPPYTTPWTWYYYISIACDMLQRKLQTAVEYSERASFAWLHAGCKLLNATTTTAAIQLSSPADDNQSLKSTRTWSLCDRRSVLLLKCVVLLPPLFVLAVWCCGVNVLCEGIRWTMGRTTRCWCWMLNRCCCSRGNA